MNERVRYRPFTEDSGLRIRLDAAPLELVLCQVRWPQISSMQGDLTHVLEAFGKLIPEYPLYSPSSEFSFEMSPSGPVSTQGKSLHHWSRTDRSAFVTVSSNSVTLSVKNYKDFPAFEGQLRGILDAVQEAFKVPLFDRVGVRYVNRIGDPSQVENIENLVRSELLGHQALSPAGEEVELVHAITQSLFKVGDAYLQARSGIIPSGETVDPSVDPLESRSWVLDIDSFQEGEALFNPDLVIARAGRLADAAYDFFKLVIKDAFVEEFSGRKV